MSENPNWPDDVIKRLKGYAEKMNITLEQAIEAFVAWLKKEFEVEDALAEDNFYLSQWSEQFVIETRNAGQSRGRETVPYVGMFIGIDDDKRDARRNKAEQALTMFQNNRDRAIDEGLVGILTAKEGRWYINGEMTDDRVDGSNLPWYGFEHDDMLLCLLTVRDGKRKPIARHSFSRRAYFLGSAESGGDIKRWTISLQGDASMNALYRKWEACKIQVIAPTKDGQDILYTNRNFVETVEYTDAWLPEHLRQAFTAERLLVNTSMHGEYAELSELIEAHGERKKETANGYTINPIVVTSGYVTYLNRDPMQSEYDPTGRNFRLAIYRQGVDPVTVWVPGRLHDEDRIFEYSDRNGEWRHYNEKTQVIVVGQLRLKPYQNEMQPSLSALGIYIPPRTARPAGGKGDTSLNQFGGNQE